MGDMIVTVEQVLTLEQARRKPGRYEEVNGTVCKWCKDCKVFLPLDQFDYVKRYGKYTAHCRAHEASRKAYATSPEGQAKTAYWSEVNKQRKEKLITGHVPKLRKHSCHQMVDGVLHKTCTNCKRLLPLDNFNKHGKSLRSQCKICRIPKAKQYREKNLTELKLKRAKRYQENPEPAKARVREWRKDNRDRAREKDKRYYQATRQIRSVKNREYNARPEVKEAKRQYLDKHREKIRLSSKTRHLARLQEDVQYRLKVRLKSRLSSYFSAQGLRKRYRTIDMLGCTIAELKSHLESLWQPGMTWNNHGSYRRGGPMTWHIDHIKPVASFDLTDPKQQRKCFHRSNLQPLWAVDNIRKGDKLNRNKEVYVQD